MSGLGQSFTDAPQSEVGASSAAVNRAQAPRTNSGMQLAAALQDLNPELKGLAMRVSREDQEVQATAAKKRALELGGKSLADAVRSGDIEATQNPHFIQDYNQESAYVRAQAAISNLTVESQSWAEKNDHVAYQKKFTEALGEIGKQFGTDDDAMHGFNAAAAPAQQQAFAANTAQVAANIEKDRAANLSQMTTEALLGTQRDHAGASSPEQLQEGIAHLKDRYIQTGGTEQEWNKLSYHAYTSAAYNSGDPELLDKLPQGIKDLPGIADQIASDKYHIMQDKGSKLRMQAQDARDRITLAGQGIFMNAYKKYGPGLITGQVNFAQLAQDNPGADPLALASALNTAQATVADNQAIDIAKTKSYTLGGGSDQVLALHTEAATLGISPELNQKIGLLVHNHMMSAEDGASIINKGIETTKGLNQQSGQVFPTPGKGLEAAATAVYGTVQPYTDLRKATDAEATTMIQWVNKSAKVAGNPPVPVAAMSQLKRQMADASSQWLVAHPGDFMGARKAAQQANGEWFASNAEQYTKPQKKTSK